ncbi:MAG: DUF3796 domain-containing protein [Halobacteriota archaeon]|nr:DUF3796 domain-containing protein [Halobacteriota archaeon]
MKNALWYLGFLSILSLLYLVEGEVGFLGFLGFLPYFSIYNVDDERMEMNLGMATRNAFIYTIFLGAVTIVYVYLVGSTESFAPAFVILFGGSLLVCILSLLYYDRTGK